MQRTRFNTLVTAASDRLSELFTNPWRRNALLLISLLFGVFMGSAVVTTAGQAARQDVPASAILLLFTEVVSILVYSRAGRGFSKEKKRFALWFEVLNIFKIGLAYSLYLEAFKLGS
ncbi:MAG: DUF565 domain-containing protein [Prochloraceae cyanobacterium]|nr:DUF565 domain-containing protein [Prochloraceae cyanobacterium]